MVSLFFVLAFRGQASEFMASGKCFARWRIVPLEIRMASLYFASEDPDRGSYLCAIEDPDFVCLLC